VGPGLLDLVLSIHMHGRVLDPRGIRVISALFRGGGFQESNHGISTCWSQLGFQLCYGNPAPGITVNRPVVVLDADKQLRFPPLFTRSDPLFEEFVKRAGVTLRHLGRHIGGTHTHTLPHRAFLGPGACLFFLLNCFLSKLLDVIRCLFCRALAPQAGWICLQ